MAARLILASGSQIRQDMLRNAGLTFDVIKPRIDEAAASAALIMDNATPRDMADALAEMKARKVSQKDPAALVIGCDQVLAFEGAISGKPDDEGALRDQLRSMRGKDHQLLSAVVIYEDSKPIWRHVGTVHMRMHMLTDPYIDTYISRNWETVRHCAGGYQLEGEGARLFSRITGDYFTVLGLPLVELLSYLGQRGVIER